MADEVGAPDAAGGAGAGPRGSAARRRHAGGRAAGEPPAGCGAPSRSSLRRLRLPALRGAAAARAAALRRTSSSASTRWRRWRRCWPPAPGSPPSPWPSSPSALTLVLGRVWCGWICPLGTLLGWLRFRPARRLARRVPPALRRVKYVLLGAIVVLAALANLTLLVLDPLSLLTRTMTTSVIPGFVAVVDALERAGMTWGPTVGVVQLGGGHLPGPGAARPPAALRAGDRPVPGPPRRRPAERAGRPLLVPVPLPARRAARPGRQGAAAAPGDERRLRRLRRLRHRLPPSTRSRSAAGSGRRRDASRAAPASSAPSARCASTASSPARTEEGMTLRRRPSPGRWAEYDPGRRAVVIAAAAGGAAPAVLSGPASRAPIKRPGLIRPPGAQDEGRLPLALPALRRVHEGLPDGRPPAGAGRGRPRGPVDAGAHVAPRLLRVRLHPPAARSAPRAPSRRSRSTEKRAQVDRHRRHRQGPLPALGRRTRPASSARRCARVPEKAIVLDGRRADRRADGGRVTSRGPRWSPSRCIGCGICEYKCPLEGRSAIVIVPPARTSRRAHRRRAADRASSARAPGYTSAMSPTTAPSSTCAPPQLFAHLDEGQLERLAGVAQPRRLPRTRPLFLQGDAADRLLPARRGPAQGLQAPPRRAHGDRAPRRGGPDLRRGGALPRRVSVEHRDDDRVPACTGSTRSRRWRSCSPSRSSP